MSDTSPDGPDAPTAPAEPPTARWALTVALTAVTAVALVVVAASWVVRTTLLDAGTYTSTLVASDADERASIEVHADPEPATVTESLLGDLRVPSSSVTQTRALGTATVRRTLPPMG